MDNNFIFNKYVLLINSSQLDVTFLPVLSVLIRINRSGQNKIDFRSSVSCRDEIMKKKNTSIHLKLSCCSLLQLFFNTTCSLPVSFVSYLHLVIVT